MFNTAAGRTLRSKSNRRDAEGAESCLKLFLRDLCASAVTSVLLTFALSVSFVVKLPLPSSLPLSKHVETTSTEVARTTTAAIMPVMM